MRPCVHNFKIVAAIGEVRPTSDQGYVADGEMMIMAKVRTEMFVINAPLFFCALLVVLFLFRFFVVFVLVLGVSGHRPTQKNCPADPTDR